MDVVRRLRILAVKYWIRVDEYRKRRLALYRARDEAQLAAAYDSEQEKIEAALHHNRLVLAGLEGERLAVQVIRKAYQQGEHNL